MTISREDRAFCERLSSLSGWDIAKELGLSYAGDADPIRHGGTFYDPTHWLDWGYAPCVEFWWDDDRDRLVVSPGTINKPDADDMETAWQCVGMDDPDDDVRNTPAAQIEAARTAWGIEPNDYVRSRSYNPDTWAEWRLWRSILPMLRAIASQQATD